MSQTQTRIICLEKFKETLKFKFLIPLHFPNQGVLCLWLPLP